VTTSGKGAVSTFNDKGQKLVLLGGMKNGEGAVSTYNDKGQKLVGLGAVDGGGMVATLDGDGRITGTLGGN
jgi:hypothetical protein